MKRITEIENRIKELDKIAFGQLDSSSFFALTQERGDLYKEYYTICVSKNIDRANQYISGMYNGDYLAINYVIEQDEQVTPDQVFLADVNITEYLSEEDYKKITDYLITEYYER